MTWEAFSLTKDTSKTGGNNMAKKKKAPKKEVPECGWIQLELILQIITEPKKTNWGIELYERNPCTCRLHNNHYY
jgi:hypothetical protein